MKNYRSSRSDLQTKGGIVRMKMTASGSSALLMQLEDKTTDTMKERWKEKYMGVPTS
jgi:hypothetical protein